MGWGGGEGGGYFKTSFLVVLIKIFFEFTGFFKL